MPSGAKKKKAARKKLENETKNNGSQVVESEDPKCHNERDSDFERGENVEAAKEACFEDVIVRTDRCSSSSSSSSSSGTSSSSSSSLGDDGVVVEKETPEGIELGRVDLQDEIFVTPSAEVEIPTEFVVENSFDESAEESIPKEEQPFDEKIEAAAGVVHLLHAKIEEKVIPDVDGGSENTSEPTDVTVRDGKVFLPQSSGVKAAEGCCVDDNSKLPETQKYTEDQPLLSPALMPVRRTSWMSCCGLFEVFSGGSSR